MGARTDDAPAAAPGLLLDDRYRLEQVRSEAGDGGRVRTVLWRALDVSLDRHVAVLLVHGLRKADARAVVTAATRASQVNDSRFVRVLDVGTTPLAGGPTTWIATEWVEGPSLAAVVRGEPLAPAAATDVARRCAEAVAELERAGLSHGRLHPDQVLLPSGGQPRITGLLVAAQLPTGKAATGAAATVDDVRAVGGLLYAALTGQWPLPGWQGLPPADARAADQARPRLVRAGISRDLDEVTHRALTGGFADARRLARALGELPSRPVDATEPEPAPARSGAWQRWAWRVVPPVVVLAVGLTGWAFGSDLGRVPLSARQARAALPPAHASAPGSAHASLVWRHAPTITSFDPDGDGSEDAGAVGLAVDRDATTSWTTDVYRGDSHFGGLKPGVGLLLDLHKPVSVRVAELSLAPAGSTVELHAGNTPPAQADDLPLVARRVAAPQRTRLTLAQPVRARYWLVWFTNLPRAGSGYQVGVAELALLG